MADAEVPPTTDAVVTGVREAGEAIEGQPPPKAQKKGGVPRDKQQRSVQKVTDELRQEAAALLEEMNQRGGRIARDDWAPMARRWKEQGFYKGEGSIYTAREMRTFGEGWLKDQKKAKEQFEAQQQEEAARKQAAEAEQAEKERLEQQELWQQLVVTQKDGEYQVKDKQAIDFNQFEMHTNKFIRLRRHEQFLPKCLLVGLKSSISQEELVQMELAIVAGFKSARKSKVADGGILFKDPDLETAHIYAGGYSNYMLNKLKNHCAKAQKEHTAVIWGNDLLFFAHDRVIPHLRRFCKECKAWADEMREDPTKKAQQPFRVIRMLHILDQASAAAEFVWHRDNAEVTVLDVEFSFVMNLSASDPACPSRPLQTSMRVAGAEEEFFYDGRGSVAMFLAGMYHMTGKKGGIKVACFVTSEGRALAAVGPSVTSAAGTSSAQ